MHNYHETHQNVFTVRAYSGSKPLVGLELHLNPFVILSVIYNMEIRERRYYFKSATSLGV